MRGKSFQRLRRAYSDAVGDALLFTGDALLVAGELLTQAGARATAASWSLRWALSPAVVESEGTTPVGSVSEGGNRG